MAFVGLRKPIIAEMTADKTYGEPFAFGKAVGLQVTPSYAEGSLNADDEQAEYDKEFNYAETTLNTSTIPIEAYEKMFGHKVNEKKTGATFNKDDQSNYVGQAWVSVEKVDGVRKFIANILYKVKYSEPSEDYATKGDSIEYKTPSITGRALPAEDGDWKDFETFDNIRDALNWIYEKFGKKMGELTVKSVAGSESGTTNITVTEEKGETEKRFYKTGKTVALPSYNEVCNENKGWKELTTTDGVRAANGDEFVVVDVTNDENYARKAGKTTVTAQA